MPVLAAIQLEKMTRKEFVWVNGEKVRAFGCKSGFNRRT